MYCITGCSYYFLKWLFNAALIIGHLTNHMKTLEMSFKMLLYCYKVTTLWSLLRLRLVEQKGHFFKYVTPRGKVISEIYGSKMKRLIISVNQLVLKDGIDFTPRPVKLDIASEPSVTPDLNYFPGSSIANLTRFLNSRRRSESVVSSRRWRTRLQSLSVLFWCISV